MKIFNVRNDGNPSISLGLKNVNSLNVCPTTQVATPAPGTQLNPALINDFDAFTVAQTGAATDVLLLPPAAPIGTELTFFAASVARIKAGLNTSGLTLNSAADTTSVPLVVGARTIFFKQSATNWTVTHIVAAGTTTSPTPS